MPVPESEVRDLLAAISEALDVPYPADRDIPHARRNEVLAARAAYMVGVLRPFTSGRAPFGGEAQIIREFAARPLPYEPEPEPEPEGGES